MCPTSGVLTVTLLTFSDKFGHSNCLILRDSCKPPDLHFAH